MLCRGGFDQTQTTTVESGDNAASDVLVFDVNPLAGLQITVDPYENGISLTHTGSTGFSMFSDSFFTFSGLDFSPPEQLTNIGYTHNSPFFNATPSWTSDSASIEFTNNSSFGLGKFLSVSI